MKIMIKKLALLLLILATIGIIADARMPQKGDRIQIQTWHGNDCIAYFGNVTDITNGLICLNVTTAIGISQGGTHDLNIDPVDMCIGMGQVTSLTWVKTMEWIKN